MAAPATERMLHALASPKWMLAFFVFAAASAVLSIHLPDLITAAWTVPLALFAVTLLASILTRPRFRRDPLLLGLHLALLAIVALVGFARLTYLDGAVTLTEGGEPFSGALDIEQRGPFHPSELDRLRFANEGVFEAFDANERGPAIHSRIRWWDSSGRSHVAEIANDVPLLLAGYRIYATYNRGFSPVFRWNSKSGETDVGAVQLRGDMDFGMANEWALPNGRTLWIMLDPQRSTLMQPGEQRSGLGAASLPHRLVVRQDGTRETLEPGQTLTFDDGSLTYLGLRSWMGYRIVYDPASDWLMGAALMLVMCMTLFYWRTLRVPAVQTATAS